MQVVAHISEQDAQSFETAIVSLLVAAVTVLVFLVWAVTWSVRYWRKRYNKGRCREPRNDLDKLS